MSFRIPTTLPGNGPAAADAASLYVGEVMHARMKPVVHRFAYKVASLLIDLDRLDEADRLSPLFSVGRFNLFSFRESDHGAEPGASLRGDVDLLLAQAGVARPERVLLLCYPRVLGFVFNPLSVYYTYGSDGALAALIYEVRNTFGERHRYVAPVRPNEVSPAGIRQSRDKQFYVSPFMPMEQRYHFRMLPPGEGVRVRILETDRDGPTLTASFVGLRRAVTTRVLAALFAAMPFHTLKVIAGIHYEAARLFIKGAPYFSHAGRSKSVTPADSSVNRHERVLIPAGGSEQ